LTRAPALAGALAAIAVLCAVPGTAEAYVGPGAGIAIATTALAFVVSLVLAIVGFLFWPVRFVWRLATRKRPPNPARVRRAVLIGLDGLDPVLVKRFMEQGKLPNLKKLAAKGGMTDLQTTFPAMSPVAWSSFATGVNPAKHGIFDFLTRDPRSYMPDLSSAEVRPPRRHLDIGDWRIPLGKPELKLLRKSRPFWEVLGRYQVPCSILRVPITFPPEKFHGTMLSAMCVPDLQGSQGSFTYYSSAGDTGDAIGGQRVAVEIDGDRIESRLRGPANPIRKDGKMVELPFSVTLRRAEKKAILKVGRRKVPLEVGAYSDWVPVVFPLGLGLKLRGICRFRLLEMEPGFRLYVTPINIDPENPILPISHPRFFSVFLSKLVGRFATLGLAEDTWALNEGVIDEKAFLEQAWANHAEREAMFFQMLRRTPKGVIACVFDGTDRIQHMFMRYLDDEHPAHARAPNHEEFASVIPDTYQRMDEMVGRVFEQVDMDDPETLVAVLSDHGFQTFRRGINLNSWLIENGYLVLEEGREQSGEWFRGVDWSKTRAFAVGLGGIFLNVEKRESQGVVPAAEANALADELAAKLSGLIDPESGKVAIREVYPAHELYKGPYAEDAPDLIVGYSAGWRASWDGVRGICGGPVFDDNTKAWSGDHCIDPKLVPGVLITNRKLGGADHEPAISDLAPTLLDLFGVPAPRYMDGRSLSPA
jgi:predicted AlkP superfamily phosphohydrolase/phosphomutase